MIGEKRLPDRDSGVQRGREGMIGRHSIIHRQNACPTGVGDEQGFPGPGLTGAEHIRAAVQVNE